MVFTKKKKSTEICINMSAQEHIQYYFMPNSQDIFCIKNKAYYHIRTKIYFPI